jgi:glycosyltransferase involved in cell wall biosynthesis
MKILISCLFLYPGKVGGAENYLINLLKGFAKNKDKNFEIDLLVNSSISLNYEDIFNRFPKLSINIRLNRGFYDFLMPFFVAKKNYDIVFSPNYITPLGFRKTRKVTTIHDVQYLHFPEFFSLKKRLWLYANHWLTLRVSNKVICISNSVKSDIINFFGKKYESKLEVIHNPIDFSRFEDNDQCESVFSDKPFILSVAASYPHKNLITLIRAFKKFKHKNSINLVLTGQIGANLIGGYQAYQDELIKEINSDQDIILTGYVSNNCLGKLYQNCDFFVFPSLFEGFGMPPVEAMGFNKLVITSKGSSLEEVTLGKAVYLNNPKDIPELEETMEDTYRKLNDSNGDELKTIIIKKYHPLSISQEYLRLFKSLMP